MLTFDIFQVFFVSLLTAEATFGLKISKMIAYTWLKKIEPVHWVAECQFMKKYVLLLHYFFNC